METSPGTLEEYSVSYSTEASEESEWEEMAVFLEQNDVLVALANDTHWDDIRIKTEIIPSL